ncbi:MAG: vanadium-dependent haloperoxidase [Chitinophagaceae bacterium]|nr:vanadium-dependent haloperoxidase [Chitinophagaceae bacterium]
MKNAWIPVVFSFLLFSFSEDKKNWKDKTEDPEYVHRAIKLMTDVMVHDIYSPPVAARTYAYISIAGYEAAVNGYPNYQSLAGQLKGLKPLPPMQQAKEYSATLSAVEAILTVGKAMVVSEGKVAAFHDSLMKTFRASGMPDSVFRNSIEYGSLIATNILGWASGDNYKQTRTFPKYDVNNDASSWKPTPPAYIKAIEPHWNEIRPFLLDSAQQFKPEPIPAFSIEQTSEFYKNAIAVRDEGLQLTAEQKEIANFWDCNPFKVNLNGHVMFASKKISPGGHWINIARLVCRKKSAGLMESLETYARLSVAIADAFISCWDEKYRSQLIRPETYINQYIDGSWMPFLQTPPFPECTSGHSVISMASSVIMEKIFGGQFSYDDSTETEFGIPVRRFTSFRQAADEAAISRFYGGIHYMPSIITGASEGRKIGAYVAGKMKTTKTPR